jgi:hypothetical protein
MVYFVRKQFRKFKIVEIIVIEQSGLAISHFRSIRWDPVNMKLK